MRDRRLLHAYRFGERGDRQWALAQFGQDQQTTRGRGGLQGIRDVRGGVGIQVRYRPVAALDSVVRSGPRN